MAEANAKREARRRRILENSENRLLRITGRNARTESEELGESSQTLHVTADMHEYNLGRNINGIIGGNKLEDDSKYNNELGTTRSTDTYNGVPTQLHPPRYTDTSNRLESTTDTTSGRLSFENYNNYDREYADRPNTSEFTDSHKTVNRKNFLPSILLHRTNYVILAAIVNILLFLKLDDLFGKTITIPCFTMMLVRLYASENIQEAQEGSLLVAALILCNIKPELTYSVRRIISFMTTVLYDLALYIFSFVLMYHGISHWMQDVDIHATSK